MDLAIPDSDKSPVVIGGLGGSGTRLVTRLVEGMGVAFDGELNGSLDNMWFSLLFVRRSILLKPEKELDRLVWLFTNAMRHGEPVPRQLRELAHDASRYGRDPVLPKATLQQATESLLAARPREKAVRHWGWKQPNTHVMARMLNRYYPKMKYIYVARNGLDMAFSGNQNQLRYFWGDLLLEGAIDDSPASALKYWVACYRRMLDEASLLTNRVHFLNYDLLCQEPRVQIRRLQEFLGIDVAPLVVNKLVADINVPDSLGRYRDHDCSQFEKHDVEFVRQMGFDVDR